MAASTGSTQQHMHRSSSPPLSPHPAQMAATSLLTDSIADIDNESTAAHTGDVNSSRCSSSEIQSLDHQETVLLEDSVPSAEALDQRSHSYLLPQSGSSAADPALFSASYPKQHNLCHTSRNAPVSHRRSADYGVSSNNNGVVKYGELVVLGYNGSLPRGENSRMKSKFSLYRRETANGVKPNKQFVCKPRDPKSVAAAASNSQATSASVGPAAVHAVSYTLSRTQAVIVEYERDSNTDMFQIGRSSESQIDFVVTDTLPPGSVNPSSGASSTPPPMPQSTISRFACRICVDRDPPYTARIYAAGFDQHNHIFLGEKASKWTNEKKEMDGLTTNGVLIIHPNGTFSQSQCQPGLWREVSVRGGIYSLRETRSVPSKSKRVDTETNVLRDGTLIDLCGATLVWRSRSGLNTAPTARKLEEYIERINASRPQCPVGLNTLVLPKRNTSSVVDRSKQPYVYLACGHVHGEHDWGKGHAGTDKRRCTMCMTEGPFVRIQVGTEASLYTDDEPLTHAFVPCAHMTSENTARYWGSVVLPFGCQGFRAMCPFCAIPLSNPAIIKLIFQDNTEF